MRISVNYCTKRAAAPGQQLICRRLKVTQPTAPKHVIPWGISLLPLPVRPFIGLTADGIHEHFGAFCYYVRVCRGIFLLGARSGSDVRVSVRFVPFRS